MNSLHKDALRAALVEVPLGSVFPSWSRRGIFATPITLTVLSQLFWTGTRRGGVRKKCDATAEPLMPREAHPCSVTIQANFRFPDGKTIRRRNRLLSFYSCRKSLAEPVTFSLPMTLGSRLT